MTGPSTDQDRSDFVSVAEAARSLGTSVATVKRRIRAGALEAEQLQRPQGFEYRVRIQRDEPAPARDEPTPITNRFDSIRPAPFTDTIHDLSAVITAATSPLLEHLAVADVTITEQAASIRELERENGRLTAENEALRASTSAGAPDLTAEASELIRAPSPAAEPVSVPWWRRWLLAVAG